MTRSLATVFRYTLLFVVGLAVGLFALGAMFGTSAKHALLHLFGTVPYTSTLADVESCTVPQEGSNEVYFVSCGGFF